MFCAPVGTCPVDGRSAAKGSWSKGAGNGCNWPGMAMGVARKEYDLCVEVGME